MNWLDLLSVHTVKQASQTKAEYKGRGTTQSLLLYKTLYTMTDLLQTYRQGMTGTPCVASSI